MGKRGPKPWEPTDEEVAKVRLYAGLGATQEMIASLIGKSVDTLTRNAKTSEALTVGKSETIMKVAGALVRKALAGDGPSAMFYLKTQGGWRETNRIEVKHDTSDGFERIAAVLGSVQRRATPDA